MIAVTSGVSSRRIEKAKHRRPRLRPSIKAFIGAGAGLTILGGVPFVVNGWGFAASLVGWLLTLAFTSGIVILAMSVILLLTDRAYHSFSKRSRSLSNVFWWFSGIVAFACAWVGVLIGLTSLLAPARIWKTQWIVLGVVLTVSSLALAVVASSLAVPLLTTLVKPRIYQARWSQTIWMFVLVFGVLAFSLWAASFLVYQPPGMSAGGVNLEVLVLIITIGFGLIGTVIHWYGMNIKSLKQSRADVLTLLGNTLDVFDREGAHGISARISVRELRRSLSPSTFHSQSFAAVPYLASYEIVETIKLIEWAMNSGGANQLPKSIESRKKSTIAGQLEMFQWIDSSTAEVIREDARDFIAYCYARVLDGAKEPELV